VTAVLLIMVPQVVGAQAPRITSAGDPTVRDDTIYALAVDPAAHPDDDWVYLLDDGVVRVERDGRTTTTYRQVVHVLSREAVEQWGEQSFSYDPGYERLTINWVRVLRPDGTVISAQPVHEQESKAPVAQTAPVYTNMRVRRLSLGGVAPNTVVDYSYTTETLQPVAPGDFSLQWFVTTGRLTRRSRYIVDLPAGLEPRIVEENIRFPRRTTTAGGRRVHVWATGEVPETEGEPFAAWPNDVLVAIRISGPVSWDAIGRWYTSLSADRYTLTDSLVRLVAGLMAEAVTFDDSLRAVHRWVAQDLRYVSLSLGIGGYRPRPPAEVLETQYGDCKDKATLFVALARHLGWEAYPVLTSASAKVDSTRPSVHAFDHVIAGLRRAGAWTFLDLTAELVPTGSVPPELEEQSGLIVFADGSVETVTLPATPPEVNWSRSRIVGTIDSTGRFSGMYEETAGGGAEYGLRSTFATVVSVEDGERFARALAQRLFDGATGDSLDAFDGRNLATEPRVAIRIRNGRLSPAGRGSWLFHLPLATFASHGLVNELEARGPRRYPIDIAQVVGPVLRLTEVEVTLPRGWTTRLPEDVTASSRFGDYASTFRQDGTTLRITRRLTGRRGSAPPDAIGELIDWLREVSRDDAQVLVLDEPR
jgi:transglutaminase-like putative cysteine protease